MPTISPPSCSFGSLQYHSGTGGLVLLNPAGFLTPTLNTWTWNGTTWALTASGPALNPTPRTGMGMASDGTNLVMFGGKGAPSTGLMNDTWLWNSGAWTNPITNDGYNNGLFIRTSHYMAAMTSPAAGVVLFGGQDLNFMWNDTWTWTAGSGKWTLQNPAVSPPIRTGAAFASNGTNKAVLFGGANSSFALNDVWLWNGTTWTNSVPLYTNGSPSVRKNACMAWYPTGNYFLIFGGSDSSGNLLNETWTYDGTSTLTKLNPSTAPSVREGAMMAYDTSSSQLILFGGRNSKSSLNDTFVWSGSNWTQL